MKHASKGTPVMKRRLNAAACLLAAVVAVTRVLTGVHYPSDVLAGLAFGAGAAVIGFLL